MNRVCGPEFQCVDAQRTVVGVVLVMGNQAAGQILTLLGEIRLIVELPQPNGPAQGVPGKIIVVREDFGVLEVERGRCSMHIGNKELHLSHLHGPGEIRTRSILLENGPIRNIHGSVLRQHLSPGRRDEAAPE